MRWNTKRKAKARSPGKRTLHCTRTSWLKQPRNRAGRFCDANRVTACSTRSPQCSFEAVDINSPMTTSSGLRWIWAKCSSLTPYQTKNKSQTLAQQELRQCSKSVNNHSPKISRGKPQRTSRRNRTWRPCCWSPPTRGESRVLIISPSTETIASKSRTQIAAVRKRRGHTTSTVCVYLRMPRMHTD